MCLFPRPNNNHNGIAYKRGLIEFECGSCPECLRKKASAWILRCVYESKYRSRIGDNCCMVTLTYDQFLRDNKGRIVVDPKTRVPVELPVNSALFVNKRHIQLFIKRLRSKFKYNNIKYLASAEYGSHTHRAHYHVLLFGVNFKDAVPYKRSKRGNQIYMSPTLTKLWGNGICTIDSLSITPATASYCTKYTMKNSGVNDTFMLVSHGIGIDELLRNFNGKPYLIDGRSYSVPRGVWERYITNKYGSQYEFDTRYRNKGDEEYEKFKFLRTLYRAIRDSDPVYTNYVVYCQNKNKEFEFSRPRRLHRIIALPEQDFHFYKVKALRALSRRFTNTDFLCYQLDPRCSEKKIENFNSAISRYFQRRIGGRKFDGYLPLPSRHNTANDRKLKKSYQLCFSFKENSAQTIDNDEVLHYNNDKIIRKKRYFTNP